MISIVFDGPCSREFYNEEDLITLLKFLCLVNLAEENSTGFIINDYMKVMNFIKYLEKDTYKHFRFDSKFIERELEEAYKEFLKS